MHPKGYNCRDKIDVAPRLSRSTLLKTQTDRMQNSKICHIQIILGHLGRLSKLHSQLGLDGAKIFLGSNQRSLARGSRCSSTPSGTSFLGSASSCWPGALLLHHSGTIACGQKPALAAGPGRAAPPHPPVLLDLSRRPPYGLEAVACLLWPPTASPVAPCSSEEFSDYC